MCIDLEIAAALDRQVKSAVSRESVQHVIKKSDPGFNLFFPGTVQIQFDGNVGLFGLALYFRMQIAL